MGASPSRTGASSGRSVSLATGISTAYTEQGDAAREPPVVLLHAWGESRRVFQRLLGHLPRDVHALAPDLRGHGDADKPAAGYDLAALAADVAAFLDACRIETAVLLGASSGGYVAQQVAVDHPGRVAGLVLCGAPRTLHGRVAPFRDEVAAQRDPLDPGWVRAFTQGFVRPGTIPEWFLDVLVEDGLRIPASTWLASLDGLTASRPPTELGTITAPTLVVVGALDTLLGRPEGDALVSAIPGARLVEYPDAGHVVHWEQPERLAHDLAAFVAARAERPRTRDRGASGSQRT